MHDVRRARLVQLGALLSKLGDLRLVKMWHVDEKNLVMIRGAGTVQEALRTLEGEDRIPVAVLACEVEPALGGTESRRGCTIC